MLGRYRWHTFSKQTATTKIVRAVLRDRLFLFLIPSMTTLQDCSLWPADIVEELSETTTRLLCLQHFSLFYLSFPVGEYMRLRFFHYL